jgi:hypothetical protein
MGGLRQNAPLQRSVGSVQWEAYRIKNISQRSRLSVKLALVPVVDQEINADAATHASTRKAIAASA